MACTGELDWWEVCSWQAVARFDDVCAGTFVPTAPDAAPVEAAARRQAVVVDLAGHDFHECLIISILLRAPRQAPSQSLQEASSLLAAGLR